MKLQVFLRRPSSKNNVTMLWSRSNPRRNAWYRAKVYVRNTGTFEVYMHVPSIYISHSELRKELGQSTYVKISHAVTMLLPEQMTHKT